ncbi:hypothetical protein LRS10_13510 [Phenylobacterium sp. J426]|uniref:tyrosine-type recombinase/integrase n=1 Tax=Phenylobacterium sp. J426 TaxID=2898439 RepID=UPI0021518A99|nr:tyrosine-type recombinase/integrase [Phenylobacterium sp. J426]MCR5875110.1 hypothetical protein [Phenylobacterium sp. J426]
MPSVKLELGKFVTLRPRADGTHRVLFEVPPRLRPSGWSATIPLPIKEPRAGNLADADEVRRIQQDAKALYEKLQRERRGIVKEPDRSMKVLVRAWQASDEWKVLKPASVQSYKAYIRNVLALSEAAGHPDPTHLSVVDVKAFLSFFNDKPTTKKHTLKVLRILMNYAIGLGWRTDNPCATVKVKVPTAKALIWEQSDVDAYVAAAKKRGRPSIAVMILMLWEIGQRVTDARSFRAGAEYRDGVFKFAQSKTGAEVEIRVSDALREMLDEQGDGQMFVFRDESTGKAYTAERLVRVFEPIRDDVVAAGGRALKMKWLRHSCVVQLARHDATIPEIASITGHTLASVHNILSHYLPRDTKVAENAQRKRGIVNS